MNGNTALQQIGAERMPAATPQSQKMVKAGFFDADSFELIQRVARAFTHSDLVPKQYQGNLSNCIIALDMAQRIGANPLMVMQNLYVVHGTPGWSSKFLIATINVSSEFSKLRYEWKGNPGADDFGCRAWAIEKETGERLDGIWVTWAMVKAEGWHSKNGSKWKTMPDQMFIYRAAAFWQRAYAPEISMGLITAEEVADTYEAQRGSGGVYEVGGESPLSQIKPAEVVDTSTGEVIASVGEENPEEPAKIEQARHRAQPLHKQWEKYDQVLAEYGPEEAENFMPLQPRPGEKAEPAQQTQARTRQRNQSAMDLE